MITNKYTLDKKFDKNISDSYLGIIYTIKYKDKYKREDEIEIDKDTEHLYLRNAYEFDNLRKTFEKLILPDDKRFMVLPILPFKSQQERSTVYISAPAGAGKTYFMNFYVKLYKKFFPNNNVYYYTFNVAESDKSLDKENFIIKNFNEFLETYSTQEALEDFSLNPKIQNCFFIFDDIETAEKNKEKSHTMYALIDIILNNKRKFKVSIAVISHIATKYKQTRNIIGEMKNYIVFPTSMQLASDRILSHYLGLPKAITNYITDDMFKTKTKWVSIDVKRRVLISQREVQFLKKLKEIKPVEQK